jgi:Cys-tRNA(Pro)/Cys-tRNA(Cys) deacylase
VSTRAIAELRRGGITHTVHEYEPPTATVAGRHERPSYGLDAAAALGVDPRRIFKTLVAAVDGNLVVAIVPVAGELDLKALADALGGRRAEMADPAAAERATGYVVGGISPIGQRRRLPTVLDASAAAFETILVSAGRRGLQVELAPGDLVHVTSAISAPIARVD